MQASGAVARGLSSCGSQALDIGSMVVARGLCCSIACGIFPDQESNLCLLPWQADGFFTTEPPGKPHGIIF